MIVDHGLERADSSFLRELVRQFRLQEPQGAWGGKDDAELLAPLIFPKRKESHPLGEPDPDVFWRIEVFYSAVGVAIEARTGVPCTPMLKMHHEGFGRLMLVAGRLVVVSKRLRDVQRFGFESLEKLSEAGERVVASGVRMIQRFPKAARHAG